MDSRGAAAESVLVAPRRVLSVDMLRGLTMALMILVNDAGDWSHIFSPFEHAKWNGWTLTDLVFPTFLFLIGTSIVFSLSAGRLKDKSKSAQVGQIVLRAAKIALLAWAINFFPRMHWTLRIYGVLMRIALCYLIAALVLLFVREAKGVAAIVVVLLVGYWVLLRFVPVPGAGHPVRDFPLLDPMWNLAAWMDRGISAWMLKWLHTGKLYEGTRDPEGLLSTLPAVGTVLLGALAGMWMRRPQSLRRMQVGLAVAGALSVVAGEVWGLWFPINKNLWTSSFVLLAGGLTAVALAVCSMLVDGREQPWPGWLRVVTWPWFVFGSNAIAAYTVAAVYSRAMLLVHVTGADGKPHGFWSWVYLSVFARGGSNEWTSLEYAMFYVVLCFLPVWWLWHKKIFIRM